MTVFDEIMSEHKKKEDYRKEKQTEEKKKREQLIEELHKKSHEFLSNKVIPLLTEANNAIKKMNYDCSITPDYSTLISGNKYLVSCKFEIPAHMSSITFYLYNNEISVKTLLKTPERSVRSLKNKSNINKKLFFTDDKKSVESIISDFMKKVFL